MSLFASILVHSGSILASNLASLSNLLASFSNVFSASFFGHVTEGGHFKAGGRGEVNLPLQEVLTRRWVGGFKLDG